MELTESYKNRLSELSGIKNEISGNWWDFAHNDRKLKKADIDYILYNQGRNTDQRNQKVMYNGFDLEQMPIEDVKSIRDRMEHPKGRGY